MGDQRKTGSLGIWDRRYAVVRARGDQMRELMKEYDNTVYHPALAALREECGAAGHGPVTAERNGLGWNWERCKWCDGRVREWRDGDEV